MLLLFFFVFGLGQAADSTARSLAALDSLYLARDTAGLTSALRSWKGESTPRIELYRGIVDSWTGYPTRAIGILRPLLDSAGSTLTREQRRDAIRALAESYSRKRQYSEATALYDAELQSSDTAVDSARARVAAKDSASAEPILDALTSPDSQPPPPQKIPGQLRLIALLFALFLVPKILQRFRIPGAITALLMGFAATTFGLFPNDPALRLFSTLGIVSLFLFAGVEIDGDELRRNAKPLVLHAAIWTGLAIVTAVGAHALLGLQPRAAALISLALVTPSTGFILSSLSSFGLTPVEQKTVRVYAIGSELIALTALFFVLQSTSVTQLAVSLAAMAAGDLNAALSATTNLLQIAPLEKGDGLHAESVAMHANALEKFVVPFGNDDAAHNIAVASKIFRR